MRGIAYGAECLRRVLGDEPAVEPATPRRRAPILVIVGFAVALLTTLLPWATFGEGASAFGAWGLSPRWALLAAIAALVGLGAAVFRLRRLVLPDRSWDVVLLALGAVVVAASVLEWFRPPFPSQPSIVPWAAAAAGAFAAGSAARCLLQDAGAIH